MQFPIGVTLGAASRHHAGVAAPVYPFEPKSNAYLLPGQFWGVPLSDGRWACGRVLAIKKEPDNYFPGNSRTFLAALPTGRVTSRLRRTESLGARS